MRSKAFTLFEVILALGILTTAVSVIAKLQVRSLDRVREDRDNIEKIFLIKKALYAIFLDIPKKLTIVVTKLEAPELTLFVQPRKIHAKSSLAGLKDRLYLINSTGKWKRDSTNQEATMVSFVFKPNPEDEKK